MIESSKNVSRINVLHIGHSKKWRGGENQVRLLLELLNASDYVVDNYIVYPKNSIAFDRMAETVKGTLPLSFGALHIFSIFQIVRFCKKHEIHILNAHSAKAHTLALRVKKFLPNIKVVVHRRVDNAIKTNSFTKRKYLSKNVDAWVAISSKIHSILMDYGIDKSKLNLIKDGMPQPVYRYKNKSEAKRVLLDSLAINEEINVPLIGFASAVDGQKNPLLFVNLIHQLKKQGLRFNAIMAGTGKLENDVLNKIKELDLEDTISYLGFRKNIQDIFQAIDIFVLPSKNEGLGTVLLEAAHSHSSLLASDVGGIGEVVLHEKTGLLAKAGNVESFTHLAQKLIEEPAYAQKLTEQAKIYVEQEFSASRMRDDMYQLYQRLSVDI